MKQSTSLWLVILGLGCSRRSPPIGWNLPPHPSDSWALGESGDGVGTEVGCQGAACRISTLDPPGAHHHSWPWSCLKRRELVIIIWGLGMPIATNGPAATAGSAPGLQWKGKQAGLLRHSGHSLSSHPCWEKAGPVSGAEQGTGLEEMEGGLHIWAHQTPHARCPGQEAPLGLGALGGHGTRLPVRVLAPSSLPSTSERP